MNKGKIEQIAAPQNLYQRPATEYVATFIGLTNRLPGASNGDEAVVFGQRVPLLAGSAKGDSVAVLVRPENLTLALAGRAIRTSANAPAWRSFTSLAPWCAWIRSSPPANTSAGTRANSSRPPCSCPPASCRPVWRWAMT